jgi:hypothetical protein
MVKKRVRRGEGVRQSRIRRVGAENGEKEA